MVFLWSQLSQLREEVFFFKNQRIEMQILGTRVRRLCTKMSPSVFGWSWVERASVYEPILGLPHAGISDLVGFEVFEENEILLRL